MHVCQESWTVLLGSAFSLRAGTGLTPPTPLMRALLRYDNEELDRLLAERRESNEGKFIGGPPILLRDASA